MRIKTTSSRRDDQSQQLLSGARRTPATRTHARSTHPKVGVRQLHYHHPPSPSPGRRASRHFRTLAPGGGARRAGRKAGRSLGRSVGSTHLSLLLLPGGIQEHVPVPVVLLLHVLLVSVVLLHVAVGGSLDVSASLVCPPDPHSGVSAPSTLRHAFTTLYASVCVCVWRKLTVRPLFFFFFFFYFVPLFLLQLSSLSLAALVFLPGGSTRR